MPRSEGAEALLFGEDERTPARGEEEEEEEEEEREGDDSLARVRLLRPSLARAERQLKLAVEQHTANMATMIKRKPSLVRRLPTPCRLFRGHCCLSCLDGLTIQKRAQCSHPQVPAPRGQTMALSPDYKIMAVGLPTWTLRITQGRDPADSRVLLLSYECIVHGRRR